MSGFKSVTNLQLASPSELSGGIDKQRPHPDLNSMRFVDLDCRNRFRRQRRISVQVFDLKGRSPAWAKALFLKRILTLRAGATLFSCSWH